MLIVGNKRTGTISMFVLSHYCHVVFIKHSSIVVVYYSIYEHNIDRKMTKIQLSIWQHVKAIR